jgi:hypothetical protein
MAAWRRAWRQQQQPASKRVRCKKISGVKSGGVANRKLASRGGHGGESQHQRRQRK